MSICEATPAPGAQGVTLGAPIRIRLSPGYFAAAPPGVDPADTAPLSLMRADNGDPVEGERTVLGDDTLVFVPDDPLVPDTRYEGLVQAQGGELFLNFRTGSFFDRRAPALDPIRGLSSTSTDECGGGFRIDVDFQMATDDGPDVDVEHLIFQTRGAGLDAPVLRKRNRLPGLPPVPFVLSEDEAAEPICVAVVAVDGVGNLAETEADCFEPIQGNFFEPLCSAAPGSPTSGRGSGWLLAFLAALLLLRRRDPKSRVFEHAEPEVV